MLQPYDYENGFYHSSHPSRIGLLLAHYELYKRIVGIPGSVIECGVMKGRSFIGFCTFREMLESQNSRKIIGFDTFAAFPLPSGISHDDRKFVQEFVDAAGDSIAEEALDTLLQTKGFGNYTLVKGDIFDTLPQYLAAHPELRISLLHLDVDVYEPTKKALELLYGHVVSGGIVACDDYNRIPGASRAVDEFFRDASMRLEKMPYMDKPAFWIKK